MHIRGFEGRETAIRMERAKKSVVVTEVRKDDQQRRGGRFAGEEG